VRKYQRFDDSLTINYYYIIILFSDPVIERDDLPQQPSAAIMTSALFPMYRIFFAHRGFGLC